MNNERNNWLYEAGIIKDYDKLKEDAGLMYAHANQRFREEVYPVAGSFKMFEYIECDGTNGDLKNIKGKDIFIADIWQGNLIKIAYDNGANIWGTDKSVVNIDIVKDKMPKGRFFQWDVAYGLPDEVKEKKFDGIASIYSFNTYEDDTKVQIIKELKSILKEDGTIYIGEVGFVSFEELEKCRLQHLEEWSDEHYMVAEELIPKLQAEGLNAEFIKVSYCAGVLKIW